MTPAQQALPHRVKAPAATMSAAPLMSALSPGHIGAGPDASAEVPEGDRSMFADLMLGQEAPAMPEATPSSVRAASDILNPAEPKDEDGAVQAGSPLWFAAQTMLQQTMSLGVSPDQAETVQNQEDQCQASPGKLASSALTIEAAALSAPQQAKGIVAGGLENPPLEAPHAQGDNQADATSPPLGTRPAAQDGITAALAGLRSAVGAGERLAFARESSRSEASSSQDARPADADRAAKVGLAQDSVASPAPQRLGAAAPAPAETTAFKPASGEPDTPTTGQSHAQNPGQGTGQAAGDSATAQLAGAQRDLGLSQLSRATVETTAQIAAQIIKKLDGRSTRFDMALTPEGMGRVDVNLEIESDGKVTAHLAFDTPGAAADMRARADELRRQLMDAGLHLSSEDLEFAERDSSSGFGGGTFERQPDRRAFSGAARLAAQTDSAVPPPGIWTSLTLTPDRVDLKV